MTEGLAQAFGPTVRVNTLMAGPYLTDVSKAWDLGDGNNFAHLSLKRAGDPARNRRCRTVFGLRRVQFHHRFDRASPTAASRERSIRMAWDFSTEPEFEKKLDWIREFVREEVEPLEVLFPGLRVPAAERRAAPHRRSAQTAGPRQWLVGTASGSGTRRAGLRRGQADVDQRDSGPQPVGADRVRNAGARHRQRGDHRPLRHAGAKGPLSVRPAVRGDLLVLLHDRAARRRRPAGVHHPRRPRRGRLGHHRAKVLLVQRFRRLVFHRRRDHRSRRPGPHRRIDLPDSRRHRRAGAGGQPPPGRSGPA